MIYELLFPSQINIYFYYLVLAENPIEINVEK